MTQNFAADVRRMTEKAKANMEFVFKASVQDVSEMMTRRQPSVKDTGGTFQEGYVPVDEGELINSVEVSVNGAITGQGGNDAPPYFVASLGTLQLGGAAEVVFTAPHARPMEYGFRTRDDNGDGDSQYAGGDVDVPGRFFVRNAVQNWGVIVDQNARLFED
ncbi:hypothetical protein CLG85_001650 [Yangia mangrovi]|uniref:Uncharacterized protein n=1 Tax=Alloyangia mangrovi TaxID=1779329 RepID=A0A2A3K0S3_9RHOB|nr:hypothetical protein [Alloyangia mangrovi]MCT4369114.1 hypothetical protein [Alloyangia mangrovi]